MGEESAAEAEWLELSVSADHEAVESVVEAFAAVGYQEGVAIEEPFVQDPDGDNLRVDMSRPVHVRTYLPASSSTPKTIEQLRSALWHIGQIRPVGDLIVTPRSEEDWANSWKEHYVPVRVGHRVVVCPPWQSYEPETDEIVIELDPGMAFGTGTHPTTRLCMELMEERLRPGERLIDVGTGSGILAIAAAQLGASEIDAIEIDPVAARQARQNVDRNGLTGTIRMYEGSLDSTFSGRRYEIVLANIIARILVELAKPLIESVGEDGHLILSGIIEDKEPMVLEAFQQLGLELVERRQLQDWVAHVWQRTQLAIT
jgi:ribosomal protein L11 methyltransferase